MKNFEGQQPGNMPEEVTPSVETAFTELQELRALAESQIENNEFDAAAETIGRIPNLGDDNIFGQTMREMLNRHLRLSREKNQLMEEKGQHSAIKEHNDEAPISEPGSVGEPKEVVEDVEDQDAIELREDIQTDPNLSEKAREDLLRFADKLERVNSVLEQGGLSPEEKRKKEAQKKKLEERLKKNPAPEQSGEVVGGPWGFLEKEKQLFEEESFRYITKTGDPDTLKYFKDNFSGKLSPDGRGYLMGKDGNETNLLPSHVIGQIGYGEVKKIVDEKLKSEEFVRPEDVFSPEEIKRLKEELDKIPGPKKDLDHVTAGDLRDAYIAVQERSGLQKEDGIPGHVTQGELDEALGTSKTKDTEEVIPDDTHDGLTEPLSTQENGGREEEFTRRIFDAQTFPDLYTVLREMDVIEGTKTNTAEDVIEGIEQLRQHVISTADDKTLTKEQADGVFQALMNLPLNEFTRRYGLRDVVKELLAVEYYGRFPAPPISTEVPGGAQEKPQQEGGLMEKEIEQAIESVPEKERPSFMRRIIGAGLLVQEKKNAAFAGAYEWAENKYTKDGEKETPLGWFLQAAAENYRRSTEVSKKQKEDIYEKKVGVGRSGLELLRSGALIMRATDPFKWFKPLRAATAGLMVVGRYGDIVKEARLKNAEALAEKTRLDEDAAMDEALIMYETFGKEMGDTSVTKEDLDMSFFANLPARLLEQFEKSGSMSFIANIGVIHTVEKIQKELKEVSKVPLAKRGEKTNAIIEKHKAFLKYLDTVVSNTGTMDTIAETGRRAGLWSKRIATALAIETALEGVHNVVDWFRHTPETDIAMMPAHGSSHGVGPMDAPDAPDAGPMSGGVASAAVESGVFESAPHPEMIDIERGGNIWSSAKELAKRFNLDKKGFAEAWAHSSVTLPDGREIPIAELNLVHEGDILSYVPGENGGVGHFEFSNVSGVRYGDALNLPGVEQATVTENPAVDLEHTQDIVARPEIDISQDQVAVDSIQSDHTEQTIVTEGTPVDTVSELGIEQHTRNVVDKELRWFFGQDYVNTEKWADIKDMSARKFEKMELDAEGKDIKLAEFKNYLIELGKKAGIHPKGGLFRREESVGDFFSRVRRATEELSLKKKA